MITDKFDLLIIRIGVIIGALFIRRILPLLLGVFALSFTHVVDAAFGK